MHGTDKANNPLQKTTSDMKLNRRQQLFVHEYLVDLNVKRAAIAAGYSEKSAHQIGVENLSKPSIKAAIDAEIEERKKRIAVTGTWLSRNWL